MARASDSPPGTSRVKGPVTPVLDFETWVSKDLHFYRRQPESDFTAVPQSLYPETTAAKWLFPQKKPPRMVPERAH
jgi:hypothetical protein